MEQRRWRSRIIGGFSGEKLVCELVVLDLLQDGEPRRVYISKSTVYCTYYHSEYPRMYVPASSSLFWLLEFLEEFGGPLHRFS